MTKVQVCTQRVPEGVLGRAHLARPFLFSEYLEREELQTRPVEDWVEGFMEDLLYYDRYEVSVVDEDGGELAYGVAAVTEDLHVGDVLSVLVSYSCAPGGGKYLMKEYLRLAREEGVQSVRRTKRVSPKLYQVLYTKVLP